MDTADKTNKSVVIVTNTLFFPARRNGVSVRYFTLIRELRKRGYLVDIIVIDKYGENYSSGHINELNNLCNNIDVIKTTHHSDNFFIKNIRRINNVAHLVMPLGMPYTLLDNNFKHSFEAMSAILKNRRRYDFGIGVGVGGCNADMLLTLRNDFRPRRILCDFIDSAYLLRKRARKSLLTTLNPLTMLEDVKTKRWERSLCRRCDCIYISDRDARTTEPCKSYVVPNSITEDGYSESHPVTLQTPNIAFLGNMAYPPNIEACAYLTDTIFPALKKRFSDINLYIIGRYPSPALREHCTDSHIHITGEVDNIWDYIHSVDVFVFPIQSGAGLQNKVLEAMFAGKPVVTSAIGNEGIDAVHDKHLYIANNVDEYVHHIEAALCNSKQVSDNARKFIEDNFSSTGFVDRYEKILRDENR